jgi:hypothetical protein
LIRSPSLEKGCRILDAEDTFNIQYPVSAI